MLKSASVRLVYITKRNTDRKVPEVTNVSGIILNNIYIPK